MAAQYSKMAMRDVISPWAEMMVSSMREVIPPDDRKSQDRKHGPQNEFNELFVVTRHTIAANAKCVSLMHIAHRAVTHVNVNRYHRTDMV
jgi:hypothetical protein